jgi:hypothetical protein
MTSGLTKVTVLTLASSTVRKTLHSIRDVEHPSDSARIMVRIIKVPPPSPSDLPTQAEQRKEIIRKISIRSNRQNPIKKWNLVSNVISARTGEVFQD